MEAVKVRYDPESDAAYVRLNDADIVDSEEVRPGIVIDYDRENRIVGIEILSVRRSRPDIDASRLGPETV